MLLELPIVPLGCWSSIHLTCILSTLLDWSEKIAIPDPTLMSFLLPSVYAYISVFFSLVFQLC